MSKFKWKWIPHNWAERHSCYYGPFRAVVEDRDGDGAIWDVYLSDNGTCIAGGIFDFQPGDASEEDYMNRAKRAAEEIMDPI